jgi:sugar O-acyltransferase (sialic acid O-acetyltransferase NeuD family)
MHLYGIIGAGGFGREIMPLARELVHHVHVHDDASVVFVDDRPPSDQINGHRVLTMEQFLSMPAETRHFNIAVGDSVVREKIANRIDPKLAKPFSVQALNHVQYDDNDIGEGAVLCAFSIITSNAKIGRFFHANIYSYVAHDCVIGDFVTFAPHVHCNGNVVIEDHAYIGTSAVIKQGTPERPIVIGRGAVVGMGAVVTKSVAAGATVIGNPARLMERTDKAAS